MGPSPVPTWSGRCSLAPVPGGTQVCARASPQLPLAVPGLLEGSQCLQTAAFVGFSPLIAMETVIKLHGGPWQCVTMGWVVTGASVPRLGHSCPAAAAAAASPGWSVCLSNSLLSIHLPPQMGNKQQIGPISYHGKTSPKKLPGRPWPEGTGWGCCAPHPHSPPCLLSTHDIALPLDFGCKGLNFSQFSCSPTKGAKSPGACRVLLLSRAVLWESLPAPGGNYTDLRLSCDLLVAGGISRVIYYAN